MNSSRISRRNCLSRIAGAGLSLGLGSCAWQVGTVGLGGGMGNALVHGQDPTVEQDPLTDPTVDPAAEESSTADSILTYADPKTIRYRCGLQLDTGRANCRGVITTFPIPREWPEQQVQLIDQDISSAFSQWEIRELDGLVSQFVSRAAALPPSISVDALLTFQLTRSRILPPEKVDDLKIPAKVGRELRQYLGDSPYIDPKSARIRLAVKEIETTAPENAWGRVEAIYDWVREKIEYTEGTIKSADDALKDGKGDCEELTSAFIAICRAMRVPARMVHVLMHCYPEFYLEDPSGKGHWIPCQAAGTRQFGSMEEYRPILQKGDRFKPPEQPLQRYVAEYFKATTVQGGKPKPKFVQEVLD